MGVNEIQRKDRSRLGSVSERTELMNKYIFPYQKYIYWICCKYSIDKSDIQDNYLDVLMNFFLYIDTYKPSCSLKTWIYSVAKRHIYYLSKRKYNRCVAINRNVDIDKQSASCEDGKSRWIDDCFNDAGWEFCFSDDIVWALKQIKPKYREPLLLQWIGYNLNDMTLLIQERGANPAKNVETIKSRLFWAKIQMKNLLTRDGKRRLCTTSPSIDDSVISSNLA